MDHDLAGAVFRRWDDGYPVSEVTFCKAASVLGIDPALALTEARYITALSKYAASSRSMSASERAYFSLAAGEDPRVMEKVAYSHGLNSDELILRKLSDRGFKPDLEKIALMVPPQEPAAGGQEQAGQEQGGQPPPQAGPEQGAQLQQAPTLFKPAPTAPEQTPPGPMGNMESLVQGQQQVFGQQAQDNGGLPPAGAEQPPPPPPEPGERIQQVAPGMDPETTQRYGQKLTEFEQEIGMQISDPKQMVKFVTEMQKVDKKYIDEGIKQMGQRLEGEMGIGSQVKGPQPTVPGFGNNQPEGSGSPASGGAEAGGPSEGTQAPLPAVQAMKGKKPPSGGQQPTAESVEKVANAARSLARILSRF